MLFIVEPTVDLLLKVSQHDMFKQFTGYACESDRSVIVGDLFAPAFVNGRHISSLPFSRQFSKF